jgi:glycosyltransferase involved in cell wall biosynthesis
MKPDNLFPVYVLLFLIFFFIGIAILKRKVFQKMISPPKLFVSKEYQPTPVLEENKKTITWIIHMYPPVHNAGAEWMAHAMNRFLIDKAGFKVNVIVPYFPMKSFEGVNIIQFSETKRIENTIRNSAVVLSHLDFSQQTIRTCAKAKRPCILVIHNHSQSNLLTTAKSMIPRRNLHLIHNSNWIQQLYSSFSYNSTVLYPPVSWKEYRVNTSKRYVTLINVNKNKGGKVLIEIAKEMPNVEFLAVKGGYDTQIIDDRVPNITYVPNTPYIQEIYAKSQIILMPSKEESWGRVAVEAMSSGIPVIAHPTPGLKEACSYAGLFADRNNISEWVNLIYRLKTDAGFYKKQSDLAFKRAQELDPTPQLQNLSTWLQEIQWKQ